VASSKVPMLHADSWAPLLQGASPRELVLEAARRNNTDLLQEVLEAISKAAKANPGKPAAEQIADILNKSRDGIGNGVLHLAALNGNCDQRPFSAPTPRANFCA
jgi:hypothetical protein